MWYTLAPQKAYTYFKGILNLDIDHLNKIEKTMTNIA